MLIKNPFINLEGRTKSISKLYKLNKSYNYIWGMKKSGNKIRKSLKYDKNKQIIFLEDGFISSFGAKKNRIPLSICYDKNGIYYNHNSNSELFKYIHENLNQNDYIRSQEVIQLWKKYNLSKYNYPNIIDPPKTPYILLIDQTKGDLSIKYGGANVNTFNRMLNFAINKWPDYKIVIKVHPDVINNFKKGCFDTSLFQKKENVILISELGQINELIRLSSAVCVVTSQVGFEALIYGKEVHVFGIPFYSGLGLTHDHHVFFTKKKKEKVSLEQLVFGSLIKYQKYLDPRNSEICEIEQIIEYLARKRRFAEFIPKELNAIGLTPWKTRQVNKYIFEANGNKVKPVLKYKNKMKNILIWGKSSRDLDVCSNAEKCISVEDGFIRSIGLGGNLYPPLSLLFDKQGIHYDFSKRSDLEDLLQNKYLTTKELKRSKKLIKLIREKKISKYNIQTNRPFYVKTNGKFTEKILVLGQVETDKSIMYGVPNNTIKKTNFSLVNKVKHDFPNSFIIYKPHPDLEEGLRAQGSQESLIKRLVACVAYNTSLNDLLEKVDRVVVFTSLGGFEALIRGIPVTTYGVPFYAGWGLTEDKLDPIYWSKRRTRKLSLEELVFITLIQYPYYFSLKYKCLTEVENIIKELDFAKGKNRNLEQIIFRKWGFLKDLIRRIFKKF